MSNDLSVAMIKLDDIDRKIILDALYITNKPYEVIHNRDDVIIQIDNLINIIEDLTYKYDELMDETRKEVE